MNIWITGIAGVLGSALAESLVRQGHYVAGNDIVRIDEAWRLKNLNIEQEIHYLWTSTTDLKISDIEGTDIIIDAGLMVADRPFGISSPEFTVENNIKPALRLLEMVREMKEWRYYVPTMVYPSSFNALYGYTVGSTFTDSMLSNPNSVYGWTKASVENLYRTYYYSYNIPIIITRVGSAFAPRMRSDELIGHLIIHALKNERFQLRSPLSKRLWTYGKDVLNFYNKLFEDTTTHIGKILHCAGNLHNEILTNFDIAQKIKYLANSTMQIDELDYEPGELQDGKPIDFNIMYSDFDWRPAYSLDEGLKETIVWFKDNIWRF